MWLVYFFGKVDLEQNTESLTERYLEYQSGLRYSMLIYCSKVCNEMLSQSTYVVIFFDEDGCSAHYATGQKCVAKYITLSLV